ncbi:50S ribosomal protein L27 [Tetrabaena socialis]|uniref:50S ribosomal protein L27 n=1 Tax=Tetrabaena socialis TaxID=47790 RepID=A0A2J8ACX4_9CHLO|nr:50S ribosomal protein L27 [Tetrabaena socialis]|eukprot:PNH10374.1 50S ribosomal protein L27 [Tetrabaena socialis]
MLAALAGSAAGASSPLRGLLLAALQPHAAWVAAAADAPCSWASHRTATKKAGGTAKQSVGSHPKNLGVKMSAGELAFPGMIIARQRGTRFHAGANTGIGRDHTIFATGVGTVRIGVQPGPGGKERRVVSVEALPEAVLAAASLSNGGATTSEARRQMVEAELVQRRAQVKRAMLRGSVPLEPALFFELPTRPDGRLSWQSVTDPALPMAGLSAPAPGQPK